jgi:hypothetical protein
MGLAIETILAAKHNITGTNFEDLTPGNGDSFTIRSFAGGSRATLEELWGLNAEHVAQFSLKSPRMHDQVRGILLAVPSGAETGENPEEPHSLLPAYMTSPVYQSDQLSVQVKGTANDDVLFAYTIHYEDLPGSDAQFHSWGVVEPMIKNLVGILVVPTQGQAAYGTPVTLDSTDDRLKADTDYAILGGQVDVPTGLISIQGPDLANYRIGFPGTTDPSLSGDFFVQADRKYGTPHIPVINANNKGSTTITAAAADTTSAVNVTLIMAELTQRITRR